MIPYTKIFPLILQRTGKFERYKEKFGHDLKLVITLGTIIPINDQTWVYDSFMFPCSIKYIVLSHFNTTCYFFYCRGDCGGVYAEDYGTLFSEYASFSQISLKGKNHENSSDEICNWSIYLLYCLVFMYNRHILCLFSLARPLF